jgi:hypothetical protein
MGQNGSLQQKPIAAVGVIIIANWQIFDDKGTRGTGRGGAPVF